VTLRWRKVERKGKEGKDGEGPVLKVVEERHEI